MVHVDSTVTVYMCTCAEPHLEVKVQQYDHLSLGGLEEGVLHVVEENVDTVTLQRRVAKTVGVSLKGTLNEQISSNHTAAVIEVDIAEFYWSDGKYSILGGACIHTNVLLAMPHPPLEEISTMKV